MKKRTELKLDRKCKNSELKLDLMAIDKKTLAYTQHGERLMLSTSPNNMVLSSIMNKEMCNETNLMDQYDAIIHPVVMGPAKTGGQVCCWILVYENWSGHWC